jgi:NAD(P)-dependent dehydrogenase (short-subunit alcohol dehydrogenase family)
VRGLAGKRVLVSGGTSGIGLAAARRLLEEGARVYLCGLGESETADALTQLHPFGAVAGQACDVQDAEQVAATVAAASDFLGGLDVLANNAGVAWREPFLEITTQHWDEMVAVNLRGMFVMAQEVARSMVARGRGGSIVNMASTNALGGEASYAHYNATKGAVLQLTRTMAVELGPVGIRVNALCPGYIETPLNEQIAADLPGFADDYARANIPLGRAGTADEVASAYAFLASDDASFITGTAFVVDGGQLAVM